MEVTISWVGVLLATLSAMIVGSIWYSPSVFLKPWLQMTGTTNDDMKRKFSSAMILMLLAALVTAYFLAHALLYVEQISKMTGVIAGVTAALGVWLGFALTTVVTSGAFENRNPMVMVITAGNRLATLVVMGIILGLFM